MQPASPIITDIVCNYSSLNILKPERLSQDLVDSYMLQIMNYQNFLNFQLLRNQDLITNYMAHTKTSEQTKNNTNASSTNSEKQQNFDQFNSSFHQVLSLGKQFKQARTQQDLLKHQGQVYATKTVKNVKRAFEDSDYEPEISNSDNYRPGKSSQSKNVPKNFSKAILLFIKRKQNIIKKIVEHQGADYQGFAILCKSLKGQINSIAELRSLWIQQNNQYAHIFRIISSLYIRKYSLQHIFNSRVEDFSKHLKYRNKISQVLKSPRQFTRMKDY